jgi:hypothetical protein
MQFSEVPHFSARPAVRQNEEVLMEALVRTTKHLLIRFLVLLLSASIAFAQGGPPPASDRPAFSQQELDQMLAPIALYPDPLLSQILMASTYPLEVVEAARWSKAHPNLRGDQAVKAVADRDWDPSVKSLVAFPQVLRMMDEKLEWTERLGDAFLAQEPQVMDTVQGLRRKAYAAGNLRSSEQIRVAEQGPIIVVEPASPEVIYVPYYDPFVVYGPWWWPAYQPIYWAPWPGYYPRPGYYVPGFAWGVGITISTGFFFGAFDWHRRSVNVVNVNNYYYNRTVIVNRQTNVTSTRTVNAAPGVWRHDPVHRRGAPYREASLQQKFGPASTSPEARRDFRGSPRPAPSTSVAPAPRPDARTAPRARTDTGIADTRPGTRREGARLEPRRESAQPEPRRETTRPEPRREITRPEPRRESPRPEPRREFAKPEPRREVPRPEPRREDVRPAPKAPVNRPEARSVPSRPAAPPEAMGRGAETRSANRGPAPAQAFPNHPAPAAGGEQRGRGGPPPGRAHDKDKPHQQ